MLESGREHDLSLEPLDGHRRGELVRQDLDHYLPAERVVARDENGGHPSTPELSIEGKRSTKGSLQLVSKNSHVTRGDTGECTKLRPAQHLRQPKRPERLCASAVFTESGLTRSSAETGAVRASDM